MHYLILKTAVFFLENCFLLISFLNSHSIIFVYKVQLMKILIISWVIDSLVDEEEGLLIFDYKIVELSIIYI